MNEILTNYEELIESVFPSGIHIQDMVEGPPNFPENTTYIKVRIDENYPLSPEQVICKLSSLFTFVEVEQYVKPFKSTLKD